jgi:HECT-like Ubiquitin-conjugating enzyme (E2)-binding
MTKIFLYAEVLTNIRQVTLYASLETAATTEETVLHIVSDKKRVTVREGDVTSGIYLPTEISGTADVTIAAGKKKEISVRLEIGDTSELLPRDDVAATIEVPWSANDLSAEMTIQCKGCQASIVQAGKVGSWKDLPSENWVEMMDFWHCHKPHDDDSKENAAGAKSYSSTSQLAVSPGTGLIDTVSFLLHKSDCTGLTVSTFLRQSSNFIQYQPGDKKETFAALEAPVATFLIQAPQIEFKDQSKAAPSSTPRRWKTCSLLWCHLPTSHLHFKNHSLAGHRRNKSLTNTTPGPETRHHQIHPNPKMQKLHHRPRRTRRLSECHQALQIRPLDPHLLSPKLRHISFHQRAAPAIDRIPCNPQIHPPHQHHHFPRIAHLGLQPRYPLFLLPPRTNRPPRHKSLLPSRPLAPNPT